MLFYPFFSRNVQFQAITLDLVAALQAQHRHFRVGPNSAESSGDVAVGSASATGYESGTAESHSGSVKIASGNTKVGDSGPVVMQSGKAENGEAGDVDVLGGLAARDGC